MFARRLWQRFETVHAVTYFSPESQAAAKAAGLRGFWMGYFGFRAAPLGAASAGVVEATFANFEPTMVRRAIPDAWDFAEPRTLTRVRAESSATALRRLSGSVGAIAAQTNPVLQRLVDGCEPIGRPLFAANRLIDPFEDPVEQFWQHCTTLREHRGDGHVAALTTAGVDGCEAHLLFAAAADVPPEVFFDNRGWSLEQQSAAHHRLVRRGLLGADGITSEGRRLSQHIEATTDDLADVPFRVLLDDGQRRELLDRIGAVASQVVAGNAIPFPNPMGLPRLSTP